jgi:hypothetical protein
MFSGTALLDKIEELFIMKSLHDITVVVHL